VGKEGEAPETKPLLWVGSCRKDLKEFPREVRFTMAYAFIWRSRVTNIQTQSR
jgi:hypothetical protein